LKIGAKTTCTSSLVTENGQSFLIGPTYNPVTFNPNLPGDHYSINIPCNGFDKGVLAAEKSPRERSAQGSNRLMSRNVVHALRAAAPDNIVISPGIANSQPSVATTCFDPSTLTSITCDSTQTFCVVIFSFLNFFS
jgi:hypothetical protein